MFKFILPLLFSITAFAQNNIRNIEADIINGQFGFTNYIQNPSCKRNASAGITASSVSVTRNTTNALDGVSDCTWDPSATAQTVSFATKTFQRGMYGQNCEARIRYYGDASLVQARVVQGSTVVSNTATLTNTTANSISAAAVASINYPCGNDTSGATVVELISTGNAASVQYSLYTGLATNLSNVSQASFYGGAEQAGAAGCTYSENTSTGLTTFVDLGTGSGCSAWSTAGAASVVSTNSHQLVLNNMPAGEYLFTLTGAIFKSGVAGQCYFRLSDGTTSYQSQAIVSSAVATLSVNTLIFQVSKSSAGNSTYKIQASDDHAGSCEWNNSAAGLSAAWKVYRFPSSSELAVTPANQRLPKVTRYTSGSGTHNFDSGYVYATVEMVGGGGGGSGSGTASSGSNATSGGNTTFGSSFLTAFGGGGGTWGSSGSITGGAVTVNSPAVQIIATQGSPGGGAGFAGSTTQQFMGANGGASPFGGYGTGGGAGATGVAALANTGSGGGGGGIASVANTWTGTGGGAGGYIFAGINAGTIANSVSYSVGSNGTGGSAGTSGFAGGNGGSGIIIVTEYFANPAPILVGSITSNSSGAEREERARITITGASACSIVSQSGNWLSNPTASSSICSLTIASGFFSDTPTCVATSDTTGGDRDCSIGGGGAQSSTFLSVQHLTTGTTGNGTCSVICRGPR